MYFRDFNNIREYLSGKSVDEGISKYFPNYCVEWIKNNDQKKNLRIYEIKGWGFWSKKISIGSIDLELKPEIKTVDIAFWLCPDKNTVDQLFGGKYYKILDYTIATNVKKILFDYAEHVAKVNNYSILQRDVHHSLREYNDDLKQFGFKLNGKKAEDHGAWLQTLKKIS